MDVSQLQMKLTLLVCVLLLSAFGEVRAGGAPRSDCEPLLPKRAAAEVFKTNIGWAMVELADLTSDDRQIWEKSHGPKCPSVIKGNFDGSGRNQYAVLLTRRNRNPEIRLAHIAQLADGSNRITILFEGESARLPVILKRPPGLYYAAGDKGNPIRITTDVIYLETIEAGVTAFYFADGKPMRLAISI